MCLLPESQGDEIIFENESHNHGTNLAGMQLHHWQEITETFACTSTYK